MKSKHFLTVVSIILLAPHFAFAANSALEACETYAAKPLLAKYKGKTIDDAAVKMIKSELKDSVLRIIRPDEPSTLDRRSNRVNLFLDAKGQLEVAFCG